MEIPSRYASKAEYVHDIFTTIAPRYDLLNSLLSFKRDRYWRRFSVKKSGLKPGGQGLDVCCGTGMLTMELARVAGPGGHVAGLDFCSEMLQRARSNIDRQGYEHGISLVEGDALNLPWEDNTFDCATIGFALRNVPDIELTIKEMTRVVRPGGRVVSLELSKPSYPVFKQVYHLYFDRLVPILGRLGIGVDGPYSYLPLSLKNFPNQSEVASIFERAGLKGVSWTELTGGIVSVHVGIKT